MLVYWVLALIPLLVLGVLALVLWHTRGTLNQLLAHMKELDTVGGQRPEIAKMEFELKKQHYALDAQVKQLEIDTRRTEMEARREMVHAQYRRRTGSPEA